MTTEMTRYWVISVAHNVLRWGRLQSTMAGTSQSKTKLKHKRKRYIFNSVLRLLNKGYSLIFYKLLASR